MRIRRAFVYLPGWKSALLAVLAAVLLILAFPDFEYWFTAWFAFVPLLWAIEREKTSTARCFVLGWIFGIAFFFGTCWWLTYAPITYAGFPLLLAYFLLFCVTVIAGLFPAFFAALTSHFLNRFGNGSILAAPCVWVFTEFSRYWLTGNNWNAVGYSQAFGGVPLKGASVGGVELVGCLLILMNVSTAFLLSVIISSYRKRHSWFFVGGSNQNLSVRKLSIGFLTLWGILLLSGLLTVENSNLSAEKTATVIAVQPNVPMDGLTYPKWIQLRQKHVALTESALQGLTTDNRQPTTVIFPESPMNFMYEEDPEFQQFVSAFASKHNVYVLFNSAEPDPENKKYFNSAVLVNTQGKEIAQYDKIYLVPFGESVPAPLQSIVPAFVGSFSYGKKYELLPIGNAKAGVMICFESHFGQLSREFVRRGADVLVEMTNDGYLGPTPVLRQHLANAVFRAVETNRPVLRVTNVGITAYITERGEVLDATEPYTEATRAWSVAESDGSQTFYVKYGDWFAWLCSVLTIALLILAFKGRGKTPRTN